MTSRGINNQSWGEIEKMHDELIRMLRFDTERSKHISGEVAYVSSENHVGAPPNSSRQDMAIVRVRQMQTVDQVFVAADECILRVLVHEHPRPLELRRRQIWTVVQQPGHPHS